MSTQPTLREFTLSTLAQGAAEELFASALDDVLRNVEDVNTDHKSKRTILLKIEFVPDQERRMCDVMVTATTKLAGVRGVHTIAYVGRHQGRLVAVEQPSQKEMFPVPDGRLRPVEKGEPHP